MKIEPLLQKQNWYRRSCDATAQMPSAAYTTSNTEKSPLMADDAPKTILTQTQMMNELDPNSHIIYNIAHRSNRPKYKYNRQTKKNEQVGCEEVARVAIAMQEAILGNKVTIGFGNPPSFRSEEEQHSDEMAIFKSMWNETGMNSAIMQFARAAFGVAEGAVYVYRVGDKIRYKVFSYENGDLIAPFNTKTDSGVVRKYMIGDDEYVEIYGKKTIQVWVKDASKDDKNFITRVKEEWDQLLGKRSEDGYMLVKEYTHGLGQCPVAYHREPCPCWDKGQSNIEAIEELLSDLMENGKYYNFQILFLTGGLVNLPDANFQGKVIASKHDGGDAKILAPADASNTFSISLEKESRMLCVATKSVFLDPKELKGQNDSGAYLRLLFFPEMQYAKEAYSRMQPFFTSLFSIFQEYVGLIQKDVLRFKNMRFSYDFVPYIPLNINEVVQNINNSVQAGTLSVQTATDVLPMANPQEFNRLKKAEKEAQGKAQEIVIGEHQPTNA